MTDKATFEPANQTKLTKADMDALCSLDTTPRIVNETKQGDFRRLVELGHVEAVTSEYVNRVMYSLTDKGVAFRQWWRGE